MASLIYLIKNLVLVSRKCDKRICIEDLFFLIFFFFLRKQLGLVHWFYLPLLIEAAFCCAVVASACVQSI